MSAALHVIRLQGPWRFKPQDPGSETLSLKIPFVTPLSGGRLRRTFHWTAPTDARETIRLIVRQTGRPTGVFLNGQAIGRFEGVVCSFETDVSVFLALKNLLELELNAASEAKEVFHGASLVMQSFHE